MCGGGHDSIMMKDYTDSQTLGNRTTAASAIKRRSQFCSMLFSTTNKIDEFWLE